MDFIIGLPKTFKQHNGILVVVNILTRAVYFIAIRITFIAEQFVDLYIEKIVRLHEAPLALYQSTIPSSSPTSEMDLRHQ